MDYKMVYVDKWKTAQRLTLSIFKKKSSIRPHYFQMFHFSCPGFFRPSGKNLTVVNINPQVWYFCSFLEKVKIQPATAPDPGNYTPNDNERVSKNEEECGTLAPKSPEEEFSQEEEELRRKRCIVADHVCAIVMFVANAILHLSFFCPYM